MKSCFVAGCRIRSRPSVFGWCSALALFASGLLCACGSDLDLGSDVLWATDNESKDLLDWYAPRTSPQGGPLPYTQRDGSPSVSTVDGPAHSGRYSLKLTDDAESDTIGPGVFRDLVAPADAYYSAWYYIPRFYQTKSQWTIMRFEARSQTDPSVISHGHDLNLRSLPNGKGIILYVYSHDPNYLQAPLADPPAFVPVETWFQIEVLYRPRADESGKLLVWLDDRLVYDLENRRTSNSNDVVWVPCNIGQDVEPFGSDDGSQGGAGGEAGQVGETSAQLEAGEGGQGGEPNSGGTGGRGNAGGRGSSGGKSGLGGAGAGAGSGASGGTSGSVGTSARPPIELYLDDAAISLRRVTRSGKLFFDR